MKKYGLLLIGIIMTLLMVGCSRGLIVYIPEITIESSPTNKPVATPMVSNTSSAIREVKLSEQILRAGIADCQFKEDWGIDLSSISANYRAGVKLSGWVVLHNGNDAERLVNVGFMPTTNALKDENKLSYKPTPSEVKAEYVTIGEKVVRLAPMETKAVNISLLIPQDIKFGTTNWAFYINADGAKINSYLQETMVTTDKNDIDLDLTLHQNLLMGDLKYIKEIKSSLGEQLNVSSYNIKSKILHIDGLKESSQRKLSLTYEYASMFTSAYNQIWFITMV